MLEEVVALLGTRRQCTPLEAPWELTESYAKLIIANGFARLGQRERAIELGEAARRVLGHTNDSVHSFLADAYFHRLECALALQPRTQRLPPILVNFLDLLPREDRYKVDPLLEASPTISVNGRAGTEDAIGTWITRRTRQLSSADVTRLDDLRTIEDPAARARLIETLFEQPESNEVTSACIDALTELPPEVAVPLLADVVASAPRHSQIVRAKAAFVTARFGFGELAAPMISSLRSSISTSFDPELVPLIVPPLFRAMRWLGADHEIAATVDDVLRQSLPEALSEPFRFIIAGVDPVRGDRLVDVAIATSATMPARLETYRAIGAGASYADRVRGSELVRKLFSQYRSMTDSYGTKSHFCLSVLRFIEPLVLAICDLELANLNVLDPTSQQLLTSGFVN